jgi:hypothetical protein
MNGYDQHNYRGNYGNDYENRNRRRDEEDDHDLSNYLSRYQERGNYYGMPNNDYEYRNVRYSREADYDQYSSGHADGYGGIRQDNSDRHNDNYNSGFGSNQGNRRSSSNSYHYGDPNPYMSNDRNGGYERTRGTGWRSESDDRRGRDYERQDNSYQYSGGGRRYDDFARDERYRQGERMTDIHADRGEPRQRRSDNNYDNQDSRRRDHDDNYATGSYSSNRAYLADHGQERDENMFDHTNNDYPRRSPRGYGMKSGPDWSARSPIGSNQHRGGDR